MPRFSIRPRQPARPLPLAPIEASTWAGVVKSLRLSPQQVRIVECLLRGMRDKDIAATLELREPTIRTYLKRIFQRVRVRDRIELVIRVFTVAQDIRAKTVCRRD